MNRYLALFLFLFQISAFHAIRAQKPESLRVELLKHPEEIRICNPYPAFGWQFHSDKQGDFQTAYQILVASSEGLIGRVQGDIWDSGKVISGNSSNVRFEGKTLQSNKTYYWKVRLWNKGGTATDYSDYQAFTTGDIIATYATVKYPLIREKIRPLRFIDKNASGFFIDFGKDAFGTLELTISSHVNDTIEIHLGEKLLNETTIDRHPEGTIRYRNTFLVVTPGTHTYTLELKPDRRNTGPRAIHLPEEFGVVMPFRYCEIFGVPATFTGSAVQQVAVFYPFDEQSSDFTSSDTTLNAIWDLCKYSIKSTSFTGVYIDGDRERIPYEADAYINQLGHYCTDQEYSMGRYSHEYLIMHPTWPTEWIMHSVLMAWADYMYTGNEQSLQHYYEDLKAKTLIALARTDGLISTSTGKVTKEVLQSIHLKDKLTDIVDWPEGERDGYEMKSVNTVVNAFHYQSLKLMAEIARVLNRQQDAIYFKKSAGQVKSSINEKLFDKSQGLYVDGEGSSHASLHANMFPLAFGLVPETHQQSVIAFVKSKGMACSVYGAQYLMEALYRSGEAGYALQLLTDTGERSWWNMIRSGSTITMEAWDIRYKPNLDWNHAWGAVPANIIPRYLWGIQPLSPGFSKFTIKPQFGGLTASKIKVPTIKGPVTGMYRGEDGRFFNLTVEIPFNTRAIIYLPNLNGDFAYRRNHREYRGTGDGEHIIIELGAGKYELEVQK